MEGPVLSPVSSPSFRCVAKHQAPREPSLGVLPPRFACRSPRAPIRPRVRRWQRRLYRNFAPTRSAQSRRWWPQIWGGDRGASRSPAEHALSHTREGSGATFQSMPLKTRQADCAHDRKKRTRSHTQAIGGNQKKCSLHLWGDKCRHVYRIFTALPWPRSCLRPPSCASTRPSPRTSSP